MEYSRYCQCFFPIRKSGDAEFGKIPSNHWKTLLWKLPLYPSESQEVALQTGNQDALKFPMMSWKSCP